MSTSTSKAAQILALRHTSAMLLRAIDSLDDLTASTYHFSDGDLDNAIAESRKGLVAALNAALDQVDRLAREA